MKKILLAVSFAMFAFSFSEAKKLYVEMEYHKNTIKLDDGSNKKAQTIKDGQGKDLKFASLIGALNYMSLQGWELLETTSVTEGYGYVIQDVGNSSTKTKVYYIFCKDVSDAELEEIVNNSYKM